MRVILTYLRVREGRGASILLDRTSHLRDLERRVAVDILLMFWLSRIRLGVVAAPSKGRQRAAQILLRQRLQEGDG